MIPESLQVLEDHDVDSQLLAGSAVDHGDESTPSPDLLFILCETVEGADRRPGDQGSNLPAPGFLSGRQGSDSTTAAMPEQTDPLRIDQALADLPPQRFQYSGEVNHVLAKGSAPEGLCVGDEDVPGPHAGAREVEADHGEATLGQELSQKRKEPPIHEALEAVTHNDGWPWARLLRGMNHHVLIAPGSSFNTAYTDHFRITTLPDTETLNVVFDRIDACLRQHA